MSSKSDIQVMGSRILSKTFYLCTGRCLGKRNAKRSLSPESTCSSKKRRKIMAKEDEVTPEHKKKTVAVFPSTPCPTTKTSRITEYFTPHTGNSSPLIVRTEPIRRRGINLDFSSPRSTPKGEKSQTPIRLPTAAGLSRFWRQQMKRKNPSTCSYRGSSPKSNKAKIIVNGVYRKISKEKYSASSPLILLNKKKPTRSIKRDNRRLSTKHVRWAVQSQSPRSGLSPFTIGEEGVKRSNKKAEISLRNGRYLKTLSPAQNLTMRPCLTPSSRRNPGTPRTMKKLSSRRKKSLFKQSPRKLLASKSTRGRGVEKSISKVLRSSTPSLSSSEKKRLFFEE